MHRKLPDSERLGQVGWQLIWQIITWYSFCYCQYFDVVFVNALCCCCCLYKRSELVFIDILCCCCCQYFVVVVVLRSMFFFVVVICTRGVDMSTLVSWFVFENILLLLLSMFLVFCCCVLYKKRWTCQHW